MPSVPLVTRVKADGRTAADVAHEILSAANYLSGSGSIMLDVLHEAQIPRGRGWNLTESVFVEEGTPYYRAWSTRFFNRGALYVMVHGPKRPATEIEIRRHLERLPMREALPPEAATPPALPAPSEPRTLPAPKRVLALPPKQGQIELPGLPMQQRGGDHAR